MDAPTQTVAGKVAIDLGLKPGGLQKVGDELVKVLADTYLLYLKTQNFHWNVTGPAFSELHVLFEKQYRDLADAADELAERVRAIGLFAPASFAQFNGLSEVEEETEVPSAEDMIESLTADNELVVRRMRHALEVADAMDDAETGDILIRRMQVHGKNAWMLRSHIQ
jgi:starvation-inducible DNA-binding protein